MQTLMAMMQQLCQNQKQSEERLKEGQEKSEERLILNC
jgi:hypothetical protein